MVKSYSFQNLKAETIIKKAFQLIGQALPTLTVEQYKSARDGINFILQSWFNENVNLWKLETDFIELTEGQDVYVLPQNIQKIDQVFLRTTTRQNNNGTAFGTIYDPAIDYSLCFDGNLNTFVTQTDTDGTIGYTYDNPTNIKYLGINSYSTENYTLLVEGIIPGKLNQQILSIPVQQYIADQIYWFDLKNAKNFNSYSISEIGGNVLSINEIYFNNDVKDFSLGNGLSREQYNNIPNKFLKGRPSTFYFDNQIIPTLTIWPTASSEYNLLYYSGQSVIASLEDYSDNFDIPSTFYTALVYGLAAQLAEQHAPDRFDRLENQYRMLLDRAIINNNLELDLNIGIYG